MKTDKKGTCVYEKDIHVSHKGQSAATNREKGQGVTRTRAGAAPCKNGLARTLLLFILRSPLPHGRGTIVYHYQYHLTCCL